MLLSFLLCILFTHVTPPECMEECQPAKPVWNCGIRYKEQVLSLAPGNILYLLLSSFMPLFTEIYKYKKKRSVLSRVYERHNVRMHGPVPLCLSVYLYKDHSSNKTPLVSGRCKLISKWPKVKVTKLSWNIPQKKGNALA